MTLLSAALSTLRGTPPLLKRPNDWRAVLALADRRGVGAAAAHGAAALGAEVDDSSARTSAALAQHRFFQLAAADVSDCLDRAGVRHAFFKGAVHDALWFGGRGWRAGTDIDVLVDDLERAAAALASFATGEPVETLRPWLGKAASVRSIPARLLGVPLIIDVHRRWLSAPMPNIADQVLARAVRDPLPRPATDDLAAFLAGNLVSDGFSGLTKLSFDIAALLTADGLVDWNHAQHRARTFGCGDAFDVVTTCVADWYQVQLPAALTALRVAHPRRLWLHAALALTRRGLRMPGVFTRALGTDAFAAGLAQLWVEAPGRLRERWWLSGQRD
jgi:hypothetical protein